MTTREDAAGRAMTTTNLTATATSSTNGVHHNDNDDDYHYVDNDLYSMYHHCSLAASLTIPEYPQFRVAEGVVTFLYPVLLLVGAVGNVVCALVLARLSRTVWSTCLYPAVLALVEMLVLLVRCGGTWCMQVTGMNPSARIMTLSDALCKTYLFVLNVLLQLWPWLLVALSVELLVACRLPLRTYHLCTRERARATVLLLTILLVCLNLNFFWTWGLLDGQVCIYVEEFAQDFMNVIWPSIEMCVQHILPLLVVTVIFLVTVVSVVRERRHRAALYEPVLKRYFLDLQALQQLKRASLVIVAFFLVVKALTFAVELTNALESRGLITVPCHQQPHYQATLKLLQTLRDASVYSFHSLKVCVYFASCAAFRQHCYSLGRKVFFCRRTSGTRARGLGNAEKGMMSKEEPAEDGSGRVVSVSALPVRSEENSCCPPTVLTLTSPV